jgi:predicted site-specific integrase-resolvase
MTPAPQQEALIETGPLMTIEAANVLGVNRATIQRWVAIEHIVPLRRLRGRGGYLFAAEEVERVRRAPRPDTRVRKHRPCRCGAPACIAAADAVA